MQMTEQVGEATRLALLERLLELATREPPPDEILREAAAALADAVGDVIVTYVELDEDGTLRPRATTNPEGLPPALPVFPEVIDALAEGPVVVPDVLEEPWLAPVWPLLEERRVRSAVDIPVHRDGRLSGILWFNASEPRAWTADEVAVLTHVTQQLRLLLDRADGRERRRQAERDLLRRDAILLAVSRSARLLLEAPSWLEAATDVLALLGEAAGATRAHVFENVPSGNSVPDCVLRAQWSVHGWERDPDDPELDRREPAPHFPRWAGLLETGETVNALTRDLPSGERELMEKLHSRSNLAVPIVVDDVWWGFVGFDDCEREREWTATEEEVLRLAASVLAGAIARERADTVLRAVFETALDAIFITDTNGRYLDVNAAACELLGVPRDDLLGRSVKEFMPPDEAATFERDWEGFQHTEPAIELWHSRRADGTVLDVEASARPNFLPGLNIAFVRDVTQRKRLEQELLGAQKLESLGRLAGGIAHDFNNLLTAIGGYTALLLERARGDDVLVHDLQQIEVAAARAADLTQRLLAFGRRQLLQPEVVDLNAVVAELEPLLRRGTDERTVLELAPSPGPAFVRADVGQLEQVLVNLAMNAQEAMPDGGTLTVATSVEVEEVLLEVRDTGVGMDDATRERAFEPFFSTSSERVGLGLASVHGIVAQSGGTVAVSSVPGAGTTFTIRLPRVVGAAPAPPSPPPAAEPKAATILLVEDEDVVRALAQRVLERRGFLVLACADGPSALATAAEHDGPIDVLLTDVVMPGLRGPEVAERVAASRPGIRVLYMSGYADADLIGSIDGDALVEKPFAVDELALRVERALAAPPYAAAERSSGQP